MAWICEGQIVSRGKCSAICRRSSGCGRTIPRGICKRHRTRFSGTCRRCSKSCNPKSGGRRLRPKSCCRCWFGALGAAADGANRLQHSVPLVRGLNWTRRCGMRPTSRKTRIGYWRRWWRRSFWPTYEVCARSGLVSGEHFTVDGTLLETWASLKSFRAKRRRMRRRQTTPPTRRWKFTVSSGQRDARMEDRSGRAAGAQAKGQEAKLSHSGSLTVENGNGLIMDAELPQANGRESGTRR